MPTTKILLKAVVKNKKEGRIEARAYACRSNLGWRIRTRRERKGKLGERGSTLTAKELRLHFVFGFL